MNTITPARSLQLAAAAWRPGTKMKTIIVDGWARGFAKEQTLHECIQAGYSACIAQPAIDKRWSTMDAEYAKHAEESRACGLRNYQGFSLQDLPQDKRSPEDKAAAIERYETFWNKRPDRAHHEIDCPNPACDCRLKINRPARGSGEMWDSLATCPYCNGTFFYESRPLRIDVAFKGFI
jgi:hypothetical protein